MTPGLTLGTLYSSGVGTNKTKQHTHTLYTFGVGSNKTKQHTLGAVTENSLDAVTPGLTLGTYILPASV